MKLYTWKNIVTGERVDTGSYNHPPCCPIGELECPACEDWKRVYTFGLSAVEGGGGSPSRRASK